MLKAVQYVQLNGGGIITPVRNDADEAIVELAIFGIAAGLTEEGMGLMVKSDQYQRGIFVPFHAIKYIDFG